MSAASRIMTTCIYTREPFQESTAEHILQNFLGARWTSKKIVCNRVQTLFGETIDPALEQGLRSFRSLLGTKGGRRGDAPSLRHIKGSQGNHYHIKPGGIPHMSQPSIQTATSEKGIHDVRIRASDMRQFDWAMAEVARRFPGVKLDMDAWKSSIDVTDEYMTERLHIGSSIGGPDYFRGLLKAAFNLLGDKAVDIALHPCFDAVRTFILSGAGDIAKHIRWPNNSKTLPLSGLERFDHVVFIQSRKNKVEGFVDFFGGIGHMIRLSDNYEGRDFSFGYRVNPLRNTNPAEIRDPPIDRNIVPLFDHGHEEPNEEARTIYKDRINQFLADHSKLAHENEIGRIVDQWFAAHTGEILSEEILWDLTHRISRFMQSMLIRND
jgi:hypothetical protein